MKIDYDLIPRIKARLSINGRNLARLINYMLRSPTGGEKGKVLFADISDPSYERYLYLLLKFFELGGFSVHVRFNANLLLNLRNYSELIFNLRGFKIVSNQQVPPTITLTDRLRTHVGTKAIEISTDFFRPEIRTARDFMFPYPMHPLMYEYEIFRDLEGARDHPRDIRLFCSGNTGDAYDNPDIAEMYGKLNRKVITELIEKEFDRSDLLILEDQSQTEKLFSTHLPSIVMFKNLTVGFHQWVSFLSRSEFFVAPPGVCMPFSHNIVESMAAGTIPITEYPEMFEPALESGVNCLAFNGGAGLVETIRNAISLPQTEIQRMRRAVSEYYDTHMGPVSVVNKFMARFPQIDRIIFNSEHLSLSDLKKGNTNSEGRRR